MGDRLEERKDFTAEVTAKLPEARKLAQVCRHRSTGVCVCVRACVLGDFANSAWKSVLQGQGCLVYGVRRWTKRNSFGPSTYHIHGATCLVSGT